MQVIEFFVCFFNFILVNIVIEPYKGSGHSKCTLYIQQRFVHFFQIL